MATKTKKVAKKVTKKVNKPSVAKKVNTSLVNASLSAINTTIDNGEKWQKLASKLIKKSEKVREQQINMIFDTAEAVKDQVMVGKDRMMDLVGLDADVIEKAKNMAINNPVSRKVVGIVEDVTETISENPMVQKAEKATEDLKNMGIAKYNELKGDVLEQASKIIDKGEAMIEDAKATPKATKKTIAKKTTSTKARATKATKTVAKKATVTKATKPVAKVAPKKTVAKKATATKAKAAKVVAKAAPKSKKAVVKKAATVKKDVVAKVAEVKTEVKK